MLVKNYMSKAPVVVKPNASVIKAQILLKEKIMEKAFLLYLVDHRENIREIFADNGSIASEQIVHLRQSSPLKTA